jgi:hypothetical protein
MMSKGRERSEMEVRVHKGSRDIQLEAPEHPHSPFMMTDFFIVRGKGVSVPGY